MPPKLLRPPSLWALGIYALQYLDQQRKQGDNGITQPIKPLEISDLDNFWKNDEEQTLTLVFIDGVMEEFSYWEFVPDYEIYNWQTQKVTINTNEIL